MPTELGAHNPRIERIRELRSTRGRREQQRFAIEGSTLIAEAQRSGLLIREVYAVGEALAARPDLAALEPLVNIFTVTARMFDRLSDVDTPTGVLAVVDLPQTQPQALLDLPGTILVLAGVNDPGNAGTLLRSAEAFGAAGALFGGGVDPFAPKVVRAAMGSSFRLPIAAVEADWLLAAAASRGRPIVAADGDGRDLAELPIPPDIFLAIGNERRGVRDWLPRWDMTVRLAQADSVDSLNAAVAGSVLLYLLSRPRYLSFTAR